MLRSVLLCGIGLCCSVVGMAPGAEPTDGASVLRRDLKRSHIALMPEWRPDDIGAFRPLRPSVVAWGNDAVHCRNNLQPLEKLARDYRKLGIKLQSCNVWMLTATARVLHDEPQYRDAVCADIADLKTFDYRTTVRDAGFVDRKTYMQGTWRNEVPLREEFLAFQRDAAAQFVRQLGDVARSAAGCPVPVGVNSYNLSPTQLATSHHADFLANEVQHYSKKDAMRAKSDIEISIRRSLVGNATRATLVAPGKSPQTLALKTTVDSVKTTVPMVELWAILAIE